ncbi:MAG TPA: alpha/beta hydrolase [Thermoanaerobaculia bacterium]
MTKPAVLLIHSGGFSSRQWRKLADLLAPDFRVVAPDLFAPRETSWKEDDGPFHFSLDVDFVESLLDEPTHLVGHSYGGLMALQLALRRPELVRSIAVYDPVAFGVLDEVEDADARAGLSAGLKQTWEPDASGVDESWLRAYVDWWSGPGAWEQAGDQTRAGFRAMRIQMFYGVMSLAADRTSRASYATIEAPTLIMGGALSPMPERRVVQRLAEALPNARMHCFEGLGHMGPISHPALVNEPIVQHLRQQ